ncbi:MAG: hypothetical protein H0T04_00895 [Chloroflexi bacterium]|nr:hypothetical protein [Chloroflexota bacterium]MDQ3407562.1 hypothetical protein [Chloroflexota bacterium]
MHRALRLVGIAAGLVLFLRQVPFRNAAWARDPGEPASDAPNPVPSPG